MELLVFRCGETSILKSRASDSTCRRSMLLVHLLSQPLGSGVGFAPLLLLPVSLGHQAAEKRHRCSPLPFLWGEFRPLAFVLQSHDARRKEKGKHVNSNSRLPIAWYYTSTINPLKSRDLINHT
jgi:hypothetical protein